MVNVVVRLERREGSRLHKPEPKTFFEDNPRTLHDSKSAERRFNSVTNASGQELAMGSAKLLISRSASVVYSLAGRANASNARVV